MSMNTSGMLEIVIALLCDTELSLELKSAPFAETIDYLGHVASTGRIEVLKHN